MGLFENITGGLDAAGGLINAGANVAFGIGDRKENKRRYEETKQREDNAIQRRAADLEAAGINKLTAAGIGGAESAGGSAGQVSGGVDMSGISKGMQGLLQARLMGAEKDNLEADTSKKNSENENIQKNTQKTGAEINKIIADTKLSEAQKNKALVDTIMNGIFENGEVSINIVGQKGSKKLYASALDYINNGRDLGLEGEALMNYVSTAMSNNVETKPEDRKKGVNSKEVDKDTAKKAGKKEIKPWGSY